MLACVKLKWAHIAYWSFSKGALPEDQCINILRKSRGLQLERMRQGETVSAEVVTSHIVNADGRKVGKNLCLKNNL